MSLKENASSGVSRSWTKYNPTLSHNDLTWLDHNTMINVFWIASSKYFTLQDFVQPVVCVCAYKNSFLMSNEIHSPVNYMRLTWTIKWFKFKYHPIKHLIFDPLACNMFKPTPINIDSQSLAVCVTSCIISKMLHIISKMLYIMAD